MTTLPHHLLTQYHSPHRHFLHKVVRIYHEEKGNEIVVFNKLCRGDYANAKPSFMEDTSDNVESNFYPEVIDLKPGDQFEMFEFTLNEWLRKETWDRYELSLSDITKILAAADRASLWQLAMILGIKITSAALKHDDDMIELVGKPIVRRKLIEEIERTQAYRVDAPYTDKLIVRDDEHIPNLPLIHWSEQEIKDAIEQFGTSTINASRTYKNTYKWRGIELLPYEIHPIYGYVVMIKVSPVDQYIRENGTPTCERNTPFQYTVTCSPNLYYYDTFEQFWMYNNTVQKWHTLIKDESSSQYFTTTTTARKRNNNKL